MSSEHESDEKQVAQWIERACLEQDHDALASAFDRYRPRLVRMVQVRLDPRLQGRIDPVDVVQDTFVDVLQGLSDYQGPSELPFFLWLRLMTGRRLMNTHRDHLGAQKRAAGREVNLRQAMPDASSVGIADMLAGSWTSPSRAAGRAEFHHQFQNALEQLEPIDREILSLRHVEELTNDEAAHSLGLSKAAASNRYVRALARLRTILK